MWGSFRVFKGRCSTMRRRCRGGAEGILSGDGAGCGESGRRSVAIGACAQFRGGVRAEGRPLAGEDGEWAVGGQWFDSVVLSPFGRGGGGGASPWHRYGGGA